MSKDQEKKIIVADAEEVARYAAGESNATTAETAAQAGATAPPTPGAGSAESVEPLQAQFAECRDKLLRAQAECANIAKRLNQQHAESLRLAGMGLARDLLAVVDGFERMFSSLDATETNDAVGAGVRLVAELLHKVLRDHGVKAIEAVGKPFDPTRHEAMMEDRHSELPAGTVTAELQRGYTMHDRVLRPVKVAVATAAGEPEEGAEEEKPPS